MNDICDIARKYESASGQKDEEMSGRMGGKENMNEYGVNEESIEQTAERVEERGEQQGQEGLRGQGWPEVRDGRNQEREEQEQEVKKHFRPLMSFVRRTSRLDKRLQHAWDTYADQYLLDIQGDHELSVAADVRIDQAWLRQQFGNDNPVIVEIGSGQGENVVAAAATNPDMNFIAVEVYQPGAAHTMLLAGKQGLNNVKVAQVNAPELFEHMADGIVSEVWTYFPDPWPKMRHHKRRLVQDSLAQQVHRVLAQASAERDECVEAVDGVDAVNAVNAVNAGVWRIATDIDDYALHVHEVMDKRQDFVNEGSVQVSLPTEHVGKGNAEDAAQLPHSDFLESERFTGRVLTNFEKKGLQAGRTIHDFTYRVV